MFILAKKLRIRSWLNSSLQTRHYDSGFQTSRRQMGSCRTGRLTKCSAGVLACEFWRREHRAGRPVNPQARTPALLEHPFEGASGAAGAVGEENLGGVCRAMRNAFFGNLKGDLRNQLRVGCIVVQVLGQSSKENEREKMLLLAHKNEM